MLDLLQLARYIIAGFDRHFGWLFAHRSNWHAAAVCVGIWPAGLGRDENAFFSQVVRIQTERGHTVATGGPYRFIRHPAYSGFILYESAVPVMLACWWNLRISAITIGLLVLRTVLEALPASSRCLVML